MLEARVRKSRTMNGSDQYGVFIASGARASGSSDNTYQAIHLISSEPIVPMLLAVQGA